jgi:hypothetical protein
MSAAAPPPEQQRLVTLLGPAAQAYLERLADMDRSLARQVREIFVLIREYGPEAVAAAIAKAHAARAFGADYIGNILRQQQQRREVQPPLRLKDPALNELVTDPLSLAEYDAFILHSRKDPHELTSTETEPVEPDLNEPPAGSGDN